MAKIKKIQQHDIDIYPVTHEDAVFDSDGVSIGEKIDQLYTNKADKSDLDNLQTEINGLENDKVDQSYVDEKLEVVDALTLNGYSIWVGTTAELEAIETRDPNTIYFEIGDDNTTDEEVVQVDIVDNILQLTTDKYQKTNMVDGTEIIFPSVNKFTEIHLYFDAETNLSLNFPDCKWRVEPNIEAGKSYEVICTYNTINWLVNIMVYS